MKILDRSQIQANHVGRAFNEAYRAAFESNRHKSAPELRKAVVEAIEPFDANPSVLTDETFIYVVANLDYIGPYMIKERIGVLGSVA